MSKTPLEFKIACLVRDRREYFNHSQAKIAKILDVTPGFIGQIEMESSRSMYSYDQLFMLAKFLKCSPKDFIPDHDFTPTDSTGNQNNKLTLTLDKLINGGILNTPSTSKLILAAMGSSFSEKTTSSVTVSLKNSPRNKIIKKIGSFSGQHIYIHKDYAAQYENMAAEELIAIIKAKEAIAFPKKKNDMEGETAQAVN